MNVQLHFEGLIPVTGGDFIDNKTPGRPVARVMTYSLKEAAQLLGVRTDLLTTVLSIPGLSEVWERHGRICDATLRLLWDKLNGGPVAQIG